MPFVSFSCHTARARISNTLLDRSSKGRYPCLVSDLRRKAFQSFTINMILVVGFSRMPLIRSRKFTFVPSLLRVFLSIGCQIFVVCFVYLIEMILWFSFTVYLYWELHQELHKSITLIFYARVIIYHIYILLNLTCSNSVQNFYTYVNELFVYSFLVIFQSEFGIRVMLVSWDVFGSLSSFSVIWKFAQNWQNSPGK